jgi:hypothetical protein
LEEVSMTDVDVDGFENQSWAEWSEKMGHLALPGWSTCRFACMGTPSEGEPQAVFVYGVARGPFGLWAQHYDVCARDSEGVMQQANTPLFNLTHIPSGKCVGLFMEREHAAFAAETAIRACPGWDAPVVEDATRARTMACWGMMGLATSKTAHAHDLAVDIGPLGIVALIPPEADRPEKLS